MIPGWPKAYDELGQRADFKLQPEDFVVEELFDLEASDDGEFNWLWIQKCGLNTEEVAAMLARHAGIPRRAISYSGLKDRQSVSRQWFCLHLAGKSNPDWSTLDAPAGFQVLQSVRHRKKLRSGAHRGNQFEIALRNLNIGEASSLEARLALVAEQGVPNYFGEQRFGRGGSNIEAARHWLVEKGASPKRFQRGMYLSAARSYLFNLVLAERVRSGLWNQAIAGDVFVLRDSHSVFCADIDDDLLSRINQGDIHPSGPLYGRPGSIDVSGEAAALETAALAADAALCEGLLRQGLDAGRRSLRLIPQNLQWNWQGDALSLVFRLPKGCFATSVVRELVCYRS